jgi:CO dehydrogenase/acetyl-CoA synthase epsilon subunit
MMDFVQAMVHAAGRPLLVVGICLIDILLVTILTMKLTESAWMQRVTSGACVFAAVWMCSI